MIACTRTPDGYMRKYWKHHVTLAYLAAATDARWKQTVTKQLNETMLYFMRYSKGGMIIDQPLHGQTACLSFLPTHQQVHRR